MRRHRKLTYLLPSVTNQEEFLGRLFRDLYGFCYSRGFAFIAYAHARESSEERRVRVIIAKDFHHKSLSDIREFTPEHPGFVFTPFDPAESHPRFSFFEAELIIPFDFLPDAPLPSPGAGYPVRVNYKDGPIAEALLGELGDYLRRPQGWTGEFYLRQLKKTEGLGEDGREDFCRKVAEVKKRLGQGNPPLAKVVLSRVKVTPPPSL